MSDPVIATANTAAGLLNKSGRSSRSTCRHLNLDRTEPVLRGAIATDVEQLWAPAGQRSARLAPAT